MPDVTLEPAASGGRFLAMLATAGPPESVYEVWISDTRGVWQTCATVAEVDGRVSFDTWRGEPGSAPAWLEKALYAALRAAWQRRQSGETWPRRIARWRPEPGQGQSSPE